MPLWSVSDPACTPFAYARRGAFPVMTPSVASIDSGCLISANMSGDLFQRVLLRTRCSTPFRKCP